MTPLKQVMGQTKQPKPVPGNFLFRLLTKHIYQSFAAALREATSNAYDAGANRVSIDFDPAKLIENADPADVTVTVSDDGCGMDETTFWQGYASIGGDKNPGKVNPETKRYPIGKFGIGAFALVPFVNQLTIYSKSQRRRSRPIRCEIAARKLAEPGSSTENYVDYVKSHISCIAITEREWASVTPNPLASGTILKAKGLQTATFNHLFRGRDSDKDLRGWFAEHDQMTEGLKELAWTLSTSLPLEYTPDKGGVFAQHTRSLKSNNPAISIVLSTVPLKRQIFSVAEKPRVRTYSYESAGVKAQGVLVADSSTVRPSHANGILLRLNNVAVGGYRRELGIRQLAIGSRITGEIHILKGLHEELNAQRDSFEGAGFDALWSNILAEVSKLGQDAMHEWKATMDAKDSEKQAKKDAVVAAALVDGVFHEPPAAAKGKTDKGKPAKKKSKSSVSGKANAIKKVDENSGKFTFDFESELFRTYGNKSERRVIMDLVRVLRTINAPSTIVAKIFGGMITLKKAEKKR